MTAIRFSVSSRRAVAVVTVLAVAAGLGWWLGSPLFIRTQADEALPGAPPATAAPAGAGGSAAPGAALPTGTAAAPAPRTLKRGALQYVDPLHNGTGEVRIVETLDLRILRFESVAITNAPDIQIYLSSDTGGRYVPASTVYLGALKATNGSFNYEIPPGLDLAPYRSVVVWCRAFNVLITWADLS